MSQRTSKTAKRGGAGKKKQARHMIIDFDRATVYEKNELHEAIDKAIDKAYKRKGPIYELDRKEAVKNVMNVLKMFSLRKRGPRFNNDITTALEIFQEELKKAGISFTRFKKLPVEEKGKFWDERIWARRQAEIIKDEPKINTPAKLREERRRIRNRVMAELRQRRPRKRINYRPN